MGAASSNSTVKVTVGNKTYTVKSNRNGLWSVKTGTLKVGTKISATVTNSFDKVSARTYVTVKNQKIAKPKVKTYKKKTKKDAYNNSSSSVRVKVKK